MTGQLRQPKHHTQDIHAMHSSNADRKLTGVYLLEMTYRSTGWGHQGCTKRCLRNRYGGKSLPLSPPLSARLTPPLVLSNMPSGSCVTIIPTSGSFVIISVKNDFPFSSLTESPHFHDYNNYTTSRRLVGEGTSSCF